jgi:hypothetical protein
MAVFWDHGNGWLGYGADAKCSSTQAYSEAPYCSIASLATLTQGEAWVGSGPNRKRLFLQVPCAMYPCCHQEGMAWVHFCCGSGSCAVVVLG